MSDTSLQRTLPNAIREKGQYALAFLVIASMLLVTNIPVFVVFFFGIFAYFVIKMLASGSKSETRDIFEFYLAANEILRDDDRRWYGFEIQETISRGERILQEMSGAPPLVSYTLGALYNKVGDHKSAVSHLAHVMENPTANEAAYAFPTPELRSYVKVLRKIERDPGDAPLTSAALRSLERSRKIRGKILLEESRTAFATAVPVSLHANGHADAALPPAPETVESPGQDRSKNQPQPERPFASIQATFNSNDEANQTSRRKKSKRTKEDEYANRQPISELLHDIYDRNVS